MVLEEGGGEDGTEAWGNREGMGGEGGRWFRSATAPRAGGSISRRDINRSDGGSLRFAMLAVFVLAS